MGWPPSGRTEEVSIVAPVGDPVHGKVDEKVDGGINTDAHLDTEQRRTIRLCLMVLAILGTGSMIGATSVLYLSVHFPLVLIALSPIGRHLILVVPTVHPAAFISIATFRRLAFYAPCFVLGRTLGSGALGWMNTRFRGAARLVKWLERVFQRARYPAVFLMPGPIMSTIAGKAQMPVATWISLVAAGLVLRMIVIVWFGDWLREPIERLLLLFDEYWVPGTIVLVAGTAVFQWHKQWHKRRVGDAAGASLTRGGRAGERRMK